MKQGLLQIASLMLLLTAISLLQISCDKDDEEPTTAILKGTITITNPDVWEVYQDSGEVQLTLFPEYSLDPPAGWGEVPDGAFGPGVPGGIFALGAPYNAQDPLIFEYQANTTSYTYELEVEPGTYSALALGFRHDFVTDPSLRTATVGVHWGNPAMVSHGVQVRVDVGGGNIVPIINYPPPQEISLAAGDELEIDFIADFGFLPVWYR